MSAPFSFDRAAARSFVSTPAFSRLWRYASVSVVSTIVTLGMLYVFFRVAKVGPLPIRVGEKYSAQYMEAVLDPGMTSSIHVHAGPEAWYTVAGETCLETSDGAVHVGRAGGPPLVVPGGLSMHLTATGTEQRRALVLVLHESSKPAITLVHDWTPKGLCNH